MKIRVYLCRCGATNDIPIKNKSSKDSMALFWCHSCGKPSWDICQRCSYKTPAESEHAFCQDCGAGREAITSGTFQIEVYENLKVIVVGTVATIVLWKFFPNWDSRISQEVGSWAWVQRMKQAPLPMMVLGWSLFLFFLYRAYLTRTVYALCTGKRRLPMGIRLIEVWLARGADDKNETQQRRQIERARGVRVAARLMKRRAKRWVRSRSNPSSPTL